MKEWKPPHEIADYRLIRELHSGSAGQIHLAHDQMFDRSVSVQFLTDEPSAPDDAELTRVTSESHALRRLHHPNVATIHSVGEVSGHPYVVSEFVRGATLDTLDTPCPPRRLLRMATGLARGLAAAHRRGILHRDIQPQNAMVAGGDEVKLLHFGLSLAPSGPAPTPPGRTPRGSTPPPSRGHGPLDLAADAGSIPYRAPELRAGTPPTRRSDVYSVGAVLYRLAAGHAPTTGVRAREIPLLSSSWSSEGRGSKIALGPGLAAVIDRCLDANPARRYGSGDELREALEALSQTSAPTGRRHGNPYRGLSAYQRSHRDMFFGRDNDTSAIVDRLRSESLVVVAGEPGIGKSSLCRAGVLPRLDGDVECLAWSTIKLRPGRWPLTSLAAALARGFGVDEQGLLTQLTSGPAQLGSTLLRHQPRGQGVVLFIDQLEELILTSNPREARRAAEALGYLVEPRRGFRLLATARGEYLARLSGLPGIGKHIAGAVQFIQPLGATQLREAILKPARSMRISFDAPSTVDTLIRDSLASPAGLSLLQFTLARLWEVHDFDLIRADHLEEVGSVPTGLSRYANSVIDRLPDHRQEQARSILVSLVTPRRTLRIVSESELISDPEWFETVNILTRAGVIAVTDAAHGAAYELASDGFIHSWERFGHWLDEEHGVGTGNGPKPDPDDEQTQMVARPIPGRLHDSGSAAAPAVPMPAPVPSTENVQPAPFVIETPGDNHEPASYRRAALPWRLGLLLLAAAVFAILYLWMS